MSNNELGHLAALETHLSHERTRLANAKTEGEKTMRAVWVAQLEKEIAGEKKILGIVEDAETKTRPSNEELLSQLLDN